jgi:hypothetical protein
MLARVEAGEPITKLIARVARYSRERPAQLARLLAPQLPGIAARVDDVAPRQLTGLVARGLGSSDGKLPRLSERRLWSIWREVKERA